MHLRSRASDKECLSRVGKATWASKVAVVTGYNPDRWISSPNGRPNFEVPSGSILPVRHEPNLWVEFDVA